MRKAALISIVFALLHASTCLWLIPRANAAFQSWFDTGILMSRTERLGHLVAMGLSFPAALWTLTLHPARVDPEELVISVVVNSTLWAACLVLIRMWLRRGAASNKGLHPTANQR